MKIVKKFLLSLFLFLIVLIPLVKTVYSWNIADPPISYDLFNNGYTFAYPYQMDFDAAGNLYVTGGSNNNDQIRKYDSAGNFVTEFGVSYSNPTGVAVDGGGNILIANSNNDQIDKFDSNGNFIASFFGTGSGNNQLNFPYAITVDGDGNVYVADAGNNRVQKYNSSLTYLATITGNSGAFNFPEVVWTDADNNLYVLDSGNNRLQKFDPNGSYLLTITGSGSAWNYPEGMTVDSSGNIYVSDSGNGRIQIFDNLGNFQQEITTANIQANLDGSVSYLSGLLMGDDGTLYVGDNTRLFKINFDRTPAIVSVSSLPGDSTTDTTPVFNGTATDSLTAISVVQFSIDAGAYQACTADDGVFDELSENYTCTTTTPLAGGSHTISIRSTDGNSQTNSGANLANYAFSVVVPGLTNSPSNDNSAVSTNTTTSSDDNTCLASKPVNTSDLFQIDVTNNTAKLFFTPIPNIDKYSISFSTKPEAEEHGEAVVLAKEGVQSHKVFYLKPGTTYYFKVRGQNGCMAGEWSNTLKVRTIRTAKKTTSTISKKFYKKWF